MLEFLYMTLILFVPFFILFLICPSFKYTKIIMIFIQLIFSFVLVSNILYKKHSLYNTPRVQYIQSTDFFPIKSLYKTENEDGEFISFDTMDDNKFSIIKNEKYSTQCLENYFIKKDEACPITDIIFDNKSSNIYNDYVQKGNNEYFYYTNQNKLGKLYKSFNYLKFEENIEYSYTTDEMNKIVRKEFNKISNPILDFKHLIKFFDVVCTIIIIDSLIFSIFEDIEDRKFGFFRIFNLLFQLIILVIHIIRYIKFIKVKQFLFDNKDIYKNDSYFPNKVINLDSAPLGISINIFIINAIYICFPNHELCLEHFKNFKIIDVSNENKGLFMFVFIIISKSTLEIFDFINDSKLFPIYNNIIYNWKINPIKNIHLNNYKTESFINWKENKLELERLEDFNYINIYSGNNSKLCGKDNLGNNLYFPDNIDCPINDIFISKYNENISGYTILKLDINNYLYYTNQNTKGKILIDFRVSSNSEIPLNPKGDSELNYFSIPFYEEIDFNNNEYLSSINYLGINSTSVSISILKKFENKINIYKKIYITKIVFFCIGNISFITFIFSIIIKCREAYRFIFFIIFSILYIVNLALIIVCLDYQKEYVINLINKINFDFQNKKIDSKLNIADSIFYLFCITYFIIFLIFEQNIEYNGLNYYKKNEITSRDIKIDKQIKNSNNIINNDDDTLSDKSAREKNNLTDENRKLNKKIVDITNERDILKNENDKLGKDIVDITDERNSLKEGKKILEKKINDISDERDILKKEKNDLIKKVDDIKKEKEILEKKIDVLEYDKNNYKKKYEELFNKESKDKYKINSIQPGEEIISINFVSMGNNDIGHYSLVCKNTDYFIKEEERLYEDFPDFKKYETYFEANGKRIKRFQTLEENNIKDKDVINIFIIE